MSKPRPFACEDCGTIVVKRRLRGRRVLCVECAIRAIETWNRAQNAVSKQYRAARASGALG